MELTLQIARLRLVTTRAAPFGFENPLTSPMYPLKPSISEPTLSPRLAAEGQINFGSSDQDQQGGTTSSWFCVRTIARHEHIAAAQLRQDSQVEVFLPRLRFQRRTRYGLAWVTEA